MKPVGIHDFSLNCALGNDLNKIWHNTLNADISGMQQDHFYLNGRSTYLGKITQPINNLPAEFSQYDYRANQLLLNCFEKIKKQYHELVKNIPSNRIGVVLGTSTAGIDTLESAVPYYDQHNKWPESYNIHNQRMGSVAEFLAQYLGIYGPAMAVSTACSSGVKAMISAQRLINSGICDVVITGGIDILCQLTIKGFDALGAMSDELCLPFSENRKGINIGEAAALFIFKKEPDEINFISGGESSDAHHISAPDPTGQGAITAMQQALQNAKMSPNYIDYLNLHGTATKQNDAMEAQAVSEVFADSVFCSSTKSLTGHTLGAAGALEIGLSALSMTAINQTGDYIPHVYDNNYDPAINPIKLAMKNNQLGVPKTIMSNSFAFGGSNASAILSRSQY